MKMIQKTNIRPIFRIPIEAHLKLESKERMIKLRGIHQVIIKVSRNFMKIV